MVNSGPLQRLQDGVKLTKAQRYGHAYERPILASRLSLPRVQRLLESFMRHGLKGAPSKRGINSEKSHFIVSHLHGISLCRGHAQ
jgi:hypothetical protein